MQRAEFCQSLCAIHYPRGSMSEFWKLEARLRHKIEIQPSGCWIWIASLDHNGYGRVRDTVNNSTKFSHRFIYELLIGPIPSDLELDHLCRIPSCCNPKHLEPVTHTENVKRGKAPEITKKRHKEKTHCYQGHPLFGNNLYEYKGKDGYINRQCKICKNEIKRNGRIYYGWS